MRKFGAISLAAFYLLLTTGMFVCLVHCSAEYFFVKPGHELAAHDDDDDHDGLAPDGNHAEHNEGKHHDHKKSCGEGKDCGCCNQHPNYTVRENTNELLDLRLTALQIAVVPIPYQQLPPASEFYQREISWLNATGPPGALHEPLYISHRSLLI